MLAYLVLSRESLCFSLIMNLRTSSSETSGSFSSFLAGAEAPQGMVTSVGRAQSGCDCCRGLEDWSSEDRLGGGERRE